VSKYPQCIALFVITIHQRYGQTDGQTSCSWFKCDVRDTHQRNCFYETPCILFIYQHV